MKKCLTTIKAGIGRWKHAALFLSSIFLVTGCSHLTSEIGPPLPSTPGIVTGKSTMKDVLKNAGVPSRVTATPEGFAFLYEHNSVTENQLGFSLNIAVIRWFKFVYARSTLGHEAWVMTFDTNDVLRAWGKENWKKPLGTGTAAQFLVTVQGLVDSTSIRLPSPQHFWGAMWLNPLPQVLNAAQSPQDGRFGLEQTLAPKFAGQRTLEMIQPLPPKQQARQSQ
jgi:hypothetical protein